MNGARGVRLFHISEEAGIARFAPRPAPSQRNPVADPVVWAVAEEGLPSYLVPRECPRVVFYAAAGTTPQDVETFLCGERAKKVVAIESAWLEPSLATTLYRYEFATGNFALHDAVAHYYLSRREETPIDRVAIANPLLELARRGVELRVTPALWELRERVFHSSLAWSFIRMRNAAAPAQGYAAYLPI